jgi:hypothetical protein
MHGATKVPRLRAFTLAANCLLQITAKGLLHIKSARIQTASEICQHSWNLGSAVQGQFKTLTVLLGINCSSSFKY